MSGYDRRLVEHLLPAVWDPSFAYGMANPSAPDPDMPRTKQDPAHGGTLYAHLADIKRAWARTEIPQVERQALLLSFGLDWTHREIAFNQGVNKSSVTRRLERGVGRLSAFLSGKSFDEGDSDTPTDD